MIVVQTLFTLLFLNRTFKENYIASNKASLI